MADRQPFLLGTTRVELLGAPSECPRNAPQVPVVLQSHQTRDPTFVQLGEGVLHQRERARLIADIGHDHRHQPGFERNADTLSRVGDGALEFVGSHWRDGDGGQLQQAGELGIAQWPIPEVRPNRHHDPQLGSGLGRRRQQTLEEAAGHRIVVDQREELLELVDDENELAVLLGKC